MIFVTKTEKLCLFDNISLLCGSYRLNANEVYSQCMFNSVIPLWGLSMKVFAQICTSCTPNVRCSEAYTPYQSALRGPVTPWPASFKQISFHIPSRPSLHFDIRGISKSIRHFIRHLPLLKGDHWNHSPEAAGQFYVFFLTARPVDFNR